MEGAGARRRKPTSRYEANDFRTTEEYQIKQAILRSLQDQEPTRQHKTKRTKNRENHQLHEQITVWETEAEEEGSGWNGERNGESEADSRKRAAAEKVLTKMSQKRKLKKRRELTRGSEEEEENGEYGNYRDYTRKKDAVPAQKTAQHDTSYAENSTNGRKHKSFTVHKDSGVHEGRDDYGAANSPSPIASPGNTSPVWSDLEAGQIRRQHSGFQPWTGSNGSLSGRVGSGRSGSSDSAGRRRDIAGGERGAKGKGKNSRDGIGKERNARKSASKEQDDIWEIRAEGDGEGRSSRFEGIFQSDESEESENSESENEQRRKNARRWERRNGRGKGKNGAGRSERGKASRDSKKYTPAPIKPTPITFSGKGPFMATGNGIESPDEIDSRWRRSAFKPIESPHKKRKTSVFDSSDENSEESETEKNRNRNRNRNSNRDPDRQSSGEEQDRVEDDDNSGNESEEPELLLSRKRSKRGSDLSESYSRSEHEPDSIFQLDDSDADRFPFNGQSHGSDSETSDGRRKGSQSPQSNDSGSEDGGYQAQNSPHQPIPQQSPLIDLGPEISDRRLHMPPEDRTPSMNTQQIMLLTVLVNVLERIMEKAKKKERGGYLYANDDKIEPWDSGFEIPDRCPVRFAAHKQTLNWLAHRGRENELFRAFIFDRMEKGCRSKLVCDLVELDLYALSQIEYRLLQEGVANDAEYSKLLMKRIRLIPRNAEPTESKLQTLREVVNRAIEQLVSFNDEWDDPDVKERAKTLAQSRRMHTSTAPTNQGKMSVDSMGRLSMLWLDIITEGSYLPNTEIGHLDTMTYYWRYVDPLADLQDQHIVAYHAPCVDISLLAQSPGLQEKVWDHMAASTHLQQHHPHLVGPHLQVGMTFSTRYWAHNPHDAFIDYLHQGGPRVWFIVPPQHAHRMRQHIVTEVDGEVYTVARLEREGIPFQVAPWQLTEAGIEVWTDVQNDKDFFVVRPGAYFMHVDCGVTISEYCLGNFKPAPIRPPKKHRK